MTTLDELLDGARARRGEPTSPGAIYSPEGNCVFFHAEDVPHRRGRVDDLLTVYLAEDDGRIVGAQIKGVSRLPLHDVMELRVQRHGRFTAIELLLWARMTAKPDEPSRLEEREKRYADSMKALEGQTIAADAFAVASA